MSIFWNCEGIFLVDFLPRSTTINGPYYASFLHRLRSSIRKKRSGKLRRDVMPLHDNAPVHKLNITQAAIQHRGVTELNHPAYFPDLASRDYHLF